MHQISAEEILNTLPTKYYVINIKTKEIVQSNDPDVELLKSSCYKQLFNKDLPCENVNDNCLCQQLIEQGKETEFIIEKGIGPEKVFYKAKATFLNDDFINASYTNISEELITKKELRINTRRLERAEKLVNFGYWEFNIDEKCMLSSKGAQEIYGVKGHEIPLKKIQNIPLPEYRKEMDKRLLDLIKNNKPYNVQFKIKRPNDGEIRHIHSIAEYRSDKKMVFGVIHDITKSFVTHKALEESEKSLNLLFENMNSAFAYHKIVTNENGTPIDYIFLNVNSKFEELVGLKREKLINKRALKIFPQLEKTWIERYGKVATTRKPVIFTDYTVVFDKHFEISAYSPKKNHFAVTVADITDRIKSKIALDKTLEELNETNQLLKTVINNIPDAIYMKDANYRKLIANKGDVINSRAKSVDAIIGKTDFDIYPEEIAKLYHEDDRKVIEKGESIINREEILPGKEKNRTILTSKFPLTNADQKVIGLVGIGRDITDIKEKEGQLQLLQRTVEQSPLPIVITNPLGLIEYVNPAFTDKTGYAFNEVIGVNPSILKSGKQENSFYKELWDTITSGKNWYGDFHNKRKDGTFYWESAVIAPILDVKNEIKHFIAIKEDITEKKLILEELKIAKEKAEESDQLKSLFLANMSHEIRTPLNGILGFSNFICAGETDREKLDLYGSIIESSGQRLISVIDDIIDISLIQSNQLKIDMSEFNLNELLNELFVLYKEQKKDKLANINLEVLFCNSNKPCVIQSDKGRIYQILRNLLDNSFKFTEKGKIEFGFVRQQKNELILQVKDTGIGIEKDKTKIIFETFRQVEQGISRKYEGTGLGLAIISGILEKLGGKIWVESEFGKGSVFYVSLPLNTASNLVKPVVEIQRKENVMKEIGTKQVVSFEDDAASFEYLKNVMSLIGHELVNFIQVSEGIEYIKNNKPDLVLMDVQLPEMSGYEATKIIKRLFPDLPIIIQTAYAMKGDREKALEAGCDDYITKPLRLKELKEKINSFLI